MKKSIQSRIIWAENLILSENVTQQNVNDLSRWIGYFQHERAMHLIVLSFVGICDMISVAMLFLESSAATILLMFLFSVLFVFYVVHYYVLENGVQKLYFLMDKMVSLKSKQEISQVS